MILGISHNNNLHSRFHATRPMSPHFRQHPHLCASGFVPAVGSPKKAIRLSLPVSTSMTLPPITTASIDREVFAQCDHESPPSRRRLPSHNKHRFGVLAVSRSFTDSELGAGLLPFTRASRHRCTYVCYIAMYVPHVFAYISRARAPLQLQN